MATDYYAEGKKYVDDYSVKKTEEGEKKKQEVNTQLDQQIAKAESDVALQTKELERDYQDIVDTNAIQKELDRRQIAETMANLGLSRSGLNETQQTAVELSAGNKNAAAMQKRQEAVDSLKRSLAEYKMETENTRRNSINEIDADVQSAIADYASGIYETATNATSADYQADRKAETDQLKLSLEATKINTENSKDSEKKYSNKGYQYAGKKDGEVYFKYYDPTANKMMTISSSDLEYMLVERDGLSGSAAASFVESLTKNAGNDYTTVRYGNGQKDDYLTNLANALTLPTTKEDVVIYNIKYGTYLKNPEDVRAHFAQQILKSGLSDEEKAKIFSLSGFTKQELEQYMSNYNTPQTIVGAGALQRIGNYILGR